MRRVLVRVVCGLCLSNLAIVDQSWALTIWGPVYDSSANTNLYVVSKGNWSQAETEAQQLGGNLVTIHSAAENDFIVSNVLQNLTGVGGPNLSAIPIWIGLYDPTGAMADDGPGGPNSQHAANFIWVDGSTSTYRNWNPYDQPEPNNYDSVEYYGTINWNLPFGNGPAGTWNDTPLGGTQGFGGNTDGPYYGLVSVPTPEPSAIDWKGGSSASTNWNFAANWNPDTTVPNGPGTKVSFGNQPAANNVVDMISQGQTVGKITFSANTSTTIQSSGGFALTLNNNGSVSPIDVEGSHTISAHVILNNDATISGTGTLNLSGGITGSHDLEVDINLTATSIQVDTLTIGSGATVTIAALPGGPLAMDNNLSSVPEPSTLALLAAAGAISLLAYSWRRRRAV